MTDDQLNTAKKMKILAIKKAFVLLVSGDYGLMEMILRCKNAIQAQSKGKALPNKFVNMQADIAPYEDWRRAKIDAVNACVTVEAVDAISPTYP